MIYLTGGGEQEEFAELDSHFFENLTNDSKILVIPQACEEDEFGAVLERIQECFSHKKVSEIHLAKNPEKMSYKEVDHFDIIMIEGGNTFLLINAIRETIFFKHLKSFAESGKTIYADSAGAILLGADVGTAFFGDEADEDNQKLQDYRGLDIIPPFILHAHYESGDDDNLQDMLYDKGCPIIALSEPAGVLIDNGIVTALGSAPVELITFSGKITIEIGDEFDLTTLD
jgi:dipeptidase E